MNSQMTTRFSPRPWANGGPTDQQKKKTVTVQSPLRGLPESKNAWGVNKSQLESTRKRNGRMTDGGKLGGPRKPVSLAPLRASHEESTKGGKKVIGNLA